MKRNLGASVLGLLLFLLLAGIAVLQYRYVTYVPDAAQRPVQEVSLNQASLPQFPRIVSPHAVLVLDVSGSMHASDPLHLQTEAVLQFFNVYRDLACEMLGERDRARMAVVLFSSIAQTIDWNGKHDPWLDISGADSDEIREVIVHYLGRSDLEPRVGQDTDYFAALEEVQRLVDDLDSPPAVMFMTDGRNEPHPLLTASFPAAQRMSRLAALTGAQRRAVEAAVSGALRWLPARGGGHVFDRRASQIPDEPLTAAETDASRRSVRDSLRAMLERRYPLLGHTGPHRHTGRRCSLARRHTPADRTSATCESTVDLDVRVFLYSVETNAPVIASRVYPDLPASLPLRLSGGGTDWQGECPRVPESPGAPIYERNVTLDAGPPRKLNVEVDVEGLWRVGIPVASKPLTGETEIRPGLRLDIVDADHRRVAPDLRNIPREASSVRAFIRKWSGHGR